MTTARKASVEIDVCEEHGVWLDHGELGVIVQHLHDRADARARARRTWKSEKKGDALQAFFELFTR